MIKTKKILLLIPAMFAFSTLASCNNGGGGDTPTPTPTPDRDWISKENWYDLTSNATSDDIGKTVNIKVNGLDHLVRLIDIDADTDENGNKIHTTWEFANLISDANGNSLAYQYRDTPDEREYVTKKIDFYNSSLNFALNGHGDNGFKKAIVGKENEILVSCYDKDTYRNSSWTTNEAYTKPIIEMLPKQITDKMKQVSKVNNEKLFVLSSSELYGSYTFYSIYKKTIKSNILRIKKQVNNNEEMTSMTYISGNERHLHSRSVTCYPGFNRALDEKGGGLYWCRDVREVLSDGYSYINRISSIGEAGYGCSYTDAYAVAPAFCI